MNNPILERYGITLDKEDIRIDRKTIDSTIDEVVNFGWQGDNNFRSLMKETAAHEAHYGQMDSKNPMQVDDITYRNFEQEPKILPLLKALGAKVENNKLDRNDLKTNIIVAGMKYSWKDKISEGSRQLKASDTQEGRAKQWKDIYNTPAGKGTQEKFLKSLETFDMRKKPQIDKTQSFLSDFLMPSAEASELRRGGGGAGWELSKEEQRVIEIEKEIEREKLAFRKKIGEQRNLLEERKVDVEKLLDWGDKRTDEQYKDILSKARNEVRRLAPIKISKENPVLNFFADLAEKIMPYEKWQEFQKTTFGPYKPENIMKVASGLGKMSTMGHLRQIGALAEVMEETPPEERKAGLTGKEEQALLNVVGEAAKTIHRPFATLQAIGRKGIENIQKGKAPLGMDTIEAGVRGFFVPEEVKSIVEKIPGITDEDIVSSKGMGTILIRAVAEAVETVMLARVIFGRFSKPKGTSEALVAEQSKILKRGGDNIIQGLRNAGKSDAEIARLVNNPNFERFILHGVKHPETGKTIAQMVTDVKVLYTAQLPFKPGDVVKFGKSIGTIIKTEGGKALLNIAGKEISASLSQLTPKAPPAKPEVVKPPIVEPLIGEARKYKTAEEFVESQRKEITAPKEVKQVFEDAPQKLRNLVDVKNIRIVDDLGGEGGRYEAKSKTIYIEKGEPIKETIIHETSHNIIEKFSKDDKPFVQEYIKEIFKERPSKVTDNYLAELEKSADDNFVRGLGGYVNTVEERMADDIAQYLINPDKLSENLKTLFSKHFGATKSQLTDIWKQAQEKPAIPKKEIVPKTIGGIVKQSGYIDPNKAKAAGWSSEDIRKLRPFMKISGQSPDALAEQMSKELMISPEETPSEVLKAALYAKQPTITEVEKPTPEFKRGFKEGWKESKKKFYLQAKSEKTSTTELKKYLSDYIKENLPLEDRGKLLTRMRDVHTKKGVVKAIELVDKIWEKGVRKDAINNLKKTIKGLDIAKLSPQEAEPVKTLLKDLDLVEHRKQTFLKLNKTKEYLEKNPEAEMPEYVLEKLSILDKKDINTFSTGDLEDIQNSIAHYVHLNKVKNQIKVGREQRRASEVLKSSIGEMKLPTKVKNDIVQSQKSKIGKLKRTSQLITDTFGIRHDHYDLIIESLSGANSTMDKVLYQGVKDGIIKELSYKQEVYKTFHNDIDIETFMRKFKIKDIGTWQNEKVLIKGLNFTRGERMALYRHSLNEDNRRAILEGGYGLKQSDTPHKIYRMSEETLNAILKDLTPTEKMFAGQPVANLFDNQGKALGKVFYEKNNYPLPLIDNYYPKEVMRISLGEKQETESVLEELKHKWVRIGLSKGMLKSRVKSKLPIYLNSLAYDINKSVTHAAAYVGLEIPLSNASKLLYDKVFKANLVSRYGLQTWKEIDKGLRDIAGDYLSYSTVEELILKMKNRLSTAYLGFSPFIMAKQILSYPLYNIYVKPKYLMQGYTDYVMDLKGTLDRHKMYSPEFAERVEGGYSRDVADVFKSGAEKRLYKGKTTVPEKMMGGIKLLDLAAVIPGTQGAVLQVLDEIVIGTFSKEVKTALDITATEAQKLSPEEKLKLAYKFADYVTERTQPMFSPEHRSSLSRGTPVEKIATQFSSFTNQALNLIRRTYREARRTGDPKMYAKLAKVLFYLLIVNTGGVFVIDEIRNRLYKRKRKTYGEAVLDSVASYFYFLRDLEKSVVSKVKRGDWGGFDISIPILSFANVIGGAIASGIRMVAGDKSKRTKEARKFIDKSLEVILTTGGLPYRTPKRILEIPFKKEKKPDIGKNPILEKYNIKGITRENPILKKYGL